MCASLRAGWSAIAMVSIALVGCAKPLPADRLPTFPVRGHVIYQGQPAAGAQVQLWAVGGDIKLAAACPHATVEADGSFNMTTYATGDGAPIGAYGMTLRWRLPPSPGKDEGPDRFQGRYADPRRPLIQVQVSAANNDLKPIHLE